MTNIAETVESLGFEVAPRAYLNDWHAMQLPITPGEPLPREEREGRQFSIDVVTGRWRQWGGSGEWALNGVVPRWKTADRGLR